MKKNNLMYRIVFILTIGLIIGCEESDELIEDQSYLNDRESVAYFANSATILSVSEEEGEDSIDVQVRISEVKDFDRAFEVMVVESETDADEEQYSISSNFIIPAGQAFGQVTVTTDFENATVDGNILTLELVNVEDAEINFRPKHEVTLARFCPVSSDYFVGTYVMTQTSGTAPFGIGSAFGGDQIVEISAVDDTTVRTFNYVYAPGSFDSPYFMNLDLSCGNILVSGTIQPGNGTLGCGDGSIGQSTPDEPGTFDLDSGDDVIIVRVEDFNPLSGCDPSSTYEAELVFTKQ